ncbi:response regulator [Gynuella sunshinyii]|uniref:Response regulator containing a CheY-like receiver domain and an HD-GYP domain n=1 Tax=Gynuella sunshinyii YC6258 TaxID=1445510 RepID=A0A0C5VDV8_9GAMM|nr:response regulator [Gynuella sunshinyii]AJQ92391.1 response regulator containing a CheY-like receiver domain and an HD-GYP domain [Gynuella sunshinyii YC6258]
MKNINIICVDDQREVLNTIAEDLKIFEQQVNIEECESAEEAQEVMEDLDSQGDLIALIISDHVMPDKTGVDFLADVKADGRFVQTKKVLLTGLATHQDTITAINQAGIDHYIEKPWKQAELQKTVRELLTHYIFNAGLDYQKYLEILDKDIVFSRLQNSTG